MGIFMFITIGIIVWYCIEMSKINEVKRAYKSAKKKNSQLFQYGYFIDYRGNMRDAKTFEICHRRWDDYDFIIEYPKSGRVRNVTSEKELAKFRRMRANYKEGDEVTVCVYKENQRHQGEYCTGMVGVRYADLKTEKGILMVVREIDNNRYYMATECGLLVRPTDGQRWWDRNVSNLSEEQLKEKEKKYAETIKLFNETQNNRKGKVTESQFYYNSHDAIDLKMEKHINDYFEEKFERERLKNEGKN